MQFISALSMDSQQQEQPHQRKYQASNSSTRYSWCRDEISWARSSPKWNAKSWHQASWQIFVHICRWELKWCSSWHPPSLCLLKLSYSMELSILTSSAGLLNQHDIWWEHYWWLGTSQVTASSTSRIMKTKLSSHLALLISKKSSPYGCFI